MYLNTFSTELNSGLENNVQYFDRWQSHHVLGFSTFVRFLPQARDVLAGHISTTGKLGCHGFSPEP